MRNNRTYELLTEMKLQQAALTNNTHIDIGLDASNREKHSPSYRTEQCIFISLPCHLTLRH